MDIMSPTIHYTAGAMMKFPLLYNNNVLLLTVEGNIAVSKQDWDSFETSWNFKKHPMI